MVMDRRNRYLVGSTYRLFTGYDPMIMELTYDKKVSINGGTPHGWFDVMPNGKMTMEFHYRNCNRMRKRCDFAFCGGMRYSHSRDGYHNVIVQLGSLELKGHADQCRYGMMRIW